MTHDLRPGGEITVPVRIDHAQFIVCDPAARLDLDSYTEQASRQGIAAWGDGGGLTVFTASRWTDTRVTVALHGAEPETDLGSWDHVVEAGIAIGSGRLHLYGPEDTNVNEAATAVPAGTYSLVVCGRGFDTTNAHGDDGTDEYALHLWPGPRLDVRVRKDGFSPLD